VEEHLAEICQHLIAEIRSCLDSNPQMRIAELTRDLQQVTGQRQRLLDAYVSGHIDKPTFSSRDDQLITQQREISTILADLKSQTIDPDTAIHDLEQAQTQPHVTVQEKRQVLEALHFYAVYDKNRGVVEMGFNVSHLPHIIHNDED
jgi:hypothetical protein